MSSPKESETNEAPSGLMDKYIPRCPAESSEDSESSSSSEDESSESDLDSDLSCSSDNNRGFRRLKTEGELLLEDLPPIQNLEISVPEEECQVIGHIFNTVETLVLVKAIPNLPAVDLESVLFLDKGDCVLGQVFDVIGPVTEPLYCIRFNSKEYISELSFNIGDPVYYTPALNYTNYVFLPDLLKMKGSDASWLHGNEPPEEEIDYSDDAQERAAKRKRKFQKRKWDSFPRNRFQNSDKPSQNETPAAVPKDSQKVQKNSARKNNQQRNSSETPELKDNSSEFHQRNDYNSYPQNGKQNRSQSKSSGLSRSSSPKERSPFSLVEPSSFQNSVNLSVSPINLPSNFPDLSNNLAHTTNNSLNFPGTAANITSNSTNFSRSPAKFNADLSCFSNNTANVKLSNNPVSFPCNSANLRSNFSLPDISKPPPLFKVSPTVAPPVTALNTAPLTTNIKPDLCLPPPSFLQFPPNPPSFGQPPPFPFSPLVQPAPPRVTGATPPTMPNIRPNAPW